jgi:hypothetical protein
MGHEQARKQSREQVQGLPFWQQGQGKKIGKDFILTPTSPPLLSPRGGIRYAGRAPPKSQGRAAGIGPQEGQTHLGWQSRCRNREQVCGNIQIRGNGDSRGASTRAKRAECIPNSKSVK